MTDRDVSHLIEEFLVPLHVRRHCAAVANFAVKLGGQLVAAGEKIDLDLLRHAALLHDMLRVVDFKKFDPGNWPDKVTKEDIAFWEALRKKYAGRGHEEVAFEILRERGFPDVAEVILKHRYLQIKEGFDRWEEKLLYYADKRTLHDTTVSLKERLKDGRLRNAPETIGTAESREIDEKIFALEAEIFKKIKKNNDIIRIEMDIQKLIDYWIGGAEKDWLACQHLYEKKDYPQCLFWGHLVLEKVLKALVVQTIKTQAPYSHDLVLLAKKAGLSLTQEQRDHLNEINTFNQFGRYDSEILTFVKKCTPEYTSQYFNIIQHLYIWLMEFFRNQK